MNNLNELLGNLSETVFKMISDGKSLDDIANELKIDKAWISMIVGNQSSDDQKVLEALRNDTKFEIYGRNTFADSLNIPVTKLNDILERLLKNGKVSFAVLWKRELVPYSLYDESCKEKLTELWNEGYSEDILSYIGKVNPCSLYKYITSSKRPKYIPTRAYSRNKKLMDCFAFMLHHLDDICKNLPKLQIELIKKNISALEKIVTEPAGPSSRLENAIEIKEEDYNDEYEQLSLPTETEEEETVNIDPKDVSVESPTVVETKSNGNGNGLSWTEVETNTLIYMIENGYSIEKMSHVLGKDSELVRDKRYTLIKTGIVTIKKSHYVDEDVVETIIPEPPKEEPVKRYKPVKYKQWTETDIAVLKRMLDDGKSTVEIAVALNRPSKETVEQKIYQLRKEGVLPTPTTKKVDTKHVWTDEEIGVLKRLVETGCSSEDIAQILGRPTVSSIDIMVCRLRKSGDINLPSPHKDTTFNKTWTDEEEETIISMRREGYKIKEIADALGKSYPQVNCKISRLREEGRM